MSGRDSIGKRPLHRLVDVAASELSKRVSDIGRIAAIKIKDLLRRFDLSKRKSDTVGQPTSTRQYHFSCTGFSSFFAFEEGMWETKISAPGGWPTVSKFLYDHYRRQKVVDTVE